MTHRVTLIPGDGIGPEVCDAARRAVEAAGVAIEWDVQEFGAEAYARDGPAAAGARDRVGARARRGAEGTDLDSVRLGLSLDQHRAAARARPVRRACAPAARYPGVATPFPQTDVVVVRMNTEDLYAGIEYDRDEDAAARLREIVAGTRGDGPAGGHRHLAEAAVAGRRGASGADARSSTRAPTAAGA